MDSAIEIEVKLGLSGSSNAIYVLSLFECDANLRMTGFDPCLKVKSKMMPSSSKTTTRTTTTKVREKKVFSLPGQKFDRPEEVSHLLPSNSCA